MLVSDHAKYHSMKPSDIKWSGKKVAAIEYLRPTSNDGEQVSLAIDIFIDDTREQLTDRINFLYSLVQDRMEDNNKAVLENNQKHYNTVKDRLLTSIKKYEDKDQKPPRKTIDALEKVELILTGAEEVLHT